MHEPDPKAIAFICCTNDAEQFGECTAFLSELDVPSGWRVELVPVVGAASMTSGYNEGMRRTSARIKVYLHQDTFIVYRRFLLDLVSLFDANPDIGLIGVTGARTLSPHGIWWESLETVGQSYGSIHGRMQLLGLGGIEEDWTDAEAVDGLLLATQYDLRWREDLFDGWHFYDISQCMEFLMAGYRVAVPRQPETWCLHECGVSYNDPEYETARRVFLNAYGPELRRRRRRLGQDGE